MYIFDDFIEKCRENKLKSKIKEMTATQAFSMATIKRISNDEDVFNAFISDVIEDIKSKIDINDQPILECIVEFPSYFNEEWKSRFIEKMKSLKYRVLYSDNAICVVSWRQYNKITEEVASCERMLLKD